ncbi:MAG: penicillin-binding protein 2 [Candidatus Goldbacteria bacterium]|nr:penicillin-binding protein 2 [Candidatus Goldiibacteriota bacterium]
MAKDEITDNIKNIYKRFIRILFLAWIVSFFVVVILIRLFYIQIIKGDYYRKLADSNCINIVKIRAPRGYIYDKNYKPLVINKATYQLSIIPYYFKKNQDINRSLDEISKIIKVPSEEIMEKLKESREYILEPIVVKRNLNEQEISQIEEKAIEINGISISQEPVRFYNYNSLASHIIGYTGEISLNQLKKDKDYYPGDIVGQTGVENFYDKELRGKDGVMYILTDAYGRQKEIIKTIAPKQGNNLVLTIDYNLQKYAENIMEENNYKGVIIASNPKTGEILCMVSKPDYDLNYFSGTIDIKEWKRLIRDKDNPLNNRVVQGLYSPGSIFKIVVGSGGLNEKIIDTTTSFLCEGIYWIKTWPYKCWRRSGHGYVDFYRAIAESCDIYFYKLGLKMKVELLYKYAVMFGLGEKTGIDLPGEKAGLVPTREWKRRIDRTPWFPGNTVMMSIGQGYITATPLQIMNIMAVIANKGYAMQPFVVKAITTENRRIIKLTEPKRLFDIKVSEEVINIMRNALRFVVQSNRGTGTKARIKGIISAGKTGTVENPHGETHAMFAGFAPFDNPEIVIFVLIEHGGSGGDVAAPVAGNIIEYYLRTKKQK